MHLVTPLNLSTRFLHLPVSVLLISEGKICKEITSQGILNDFGPVLSRMIDELHLLVNMLVIDVISGSCSHPPLQKHAID